MSNSVFPIPDPINEPILNYAPGSPERAELKAQLQQMQDNPVNIPMQIGGQPVTSGKQEEMRCPHNLSQLLGTYHVCTNQMDSAIEAATAAKPAWAAMPWGERASIFLKAADLLATEYRQVLNAATMLCASKTAYQAEIDSACELIDFWRFNAYYMKQLYEDQPYSPRSMSNSLEYRPLEGFVLAITPFNFTSIAGNLPTAPALMGNTVIWKPSPRAMLSAHYLMQLLQEAGLPDGVINMIAGPGEPIVPPIIKHPDLGGIHFTGSTAVFASMWKTVGDNFTNYKSIPRIVGETGGKDFIVAHASSDTTALATAMVRGAFEFQGQKCSAASRAYIPDSIWPDVKQQVVDMTARIKMGDICDFSNFMGAVINEAAFNKTKSYIDYAKENDGFEVICGGGCDMSKGYFVEPTVIRSYEPKSKLMSEEIFAPVLTVYVYPEKEYKEILHICDATSPYALTGAIFSQDRAAVALAKDILRNAAGNFYINDKPTGAVVGQQPFGGSRASGTNDKAGSRLNLERWVSPRTIKENYIPARDFPYPHMDEK
jgi:1-pyrroline-5-carboxylate dehydrogenase